MATKRRQHDANDTLASIPWYWRDWRASKARAVLSLEARAVYRELLDAQWAEPDCALPGEDTALAGLAGVSMEMWVVVRAQVLAFFDQLSDGRQRNPRTYFEWKRAKSARKVRRKSASDAAKARWEKEKRRLETPIKDDASRMPDACASDALRLRHPSAVIRQPSTGGGGAPPPADDGPRTGLFLTDEARSKAQAEGKASLAEVVRLSNDDPGEVLKRCSRIPKSGWFLVSLDAPSKDEHLLRTVQALRDEAEKLKRSDAGEKEGLLTSAEYQRRRKA